MPAEELKNGTGVPTDTPTRYRDPERNHNFARRIRLLHAVKGSYRNNGNSMNRSLSRAAGWKTWGWPPTLLFGLYRVDLDGTVIRLYQGTGCSNGMGFSADQKYLYWTCSTSNGILRFDCDRKTGDLSNRRELLRVPASEHP